MRPFLAAFGCSSIAFGTAMAGAADMSPVRPDPMVQTVKDLTTDAFEGRAPGTEGEKRTVRYLIDRFTAMGLQPGGENGGWTQKVPIVRTRIKAVHALSVTGDGPPIDYVQGRDIYVTAPQPLDRAVVDRSELVFVGYGIFAPDQGRDDFKGVDLKGKTAVFLIGPPDLHTSDGGTPKPTQFARWTYKYDEAARRGAAAVLLIHELPDAAIGWSTVIAGQSELYDLPHDDGSHSLVLRAVLQHDKAAELFARAHLDLAALKRAANAPDFHPVSLGSQRFSADVEIEHGVVETANVIAKRTGTRRPNETVMFAAHWDAFGKTDVPGTGIVIRRGANDDAAGVAAVLETAHAFAIEKPPERTVVFALWTAEERGLLGSEYYARHPIYPLETTAANFTFDILNTAGPARNVVLVGGGLNSLEKDLGAAIAQQHRVLDFEPHPESGHYYRADHFSLARRGVPSLIMMALSGAPDLLTGGTAAGAKWMNDYIANCYHKSCDAWTPAWDMRGAAQDTGLLFSIGEALANSDRWPQWNPHTEFTAVRLQSDAFRKRDISDDR